MMSIYKMPGTRDVPPLADMLADLGRPHPATIAKMLHVDVKTVRRWLAANAAPWPVMLSLYWLTKWGLAHLDADLFNAAQAYRQLSDAQGRELAQARDLYSDLVSRLGTRPATRQPFNQRLKPRHAPLVDHRPCQQRQRTGLVQERPDLRAHAAPHA